MPLKIVLLIVAAVASVGVNAQGYIYSTHWFNTVLDHFDFQTHKTFPLRYLVADQYWDGKGPILFYTGNEGPIDLFCNNTGFMWDIAPELKALLVFGEHRYYGESMPFGNTSLSTPDHMQYLTSEQALADYALLLKEVKRKWNIRHDMPVVALGGSYGGMLSAWFRVKYPHVVVGAIAASAPVLMYQGLVDPEDYSQIITNDFSNANPVSVDQIRKSWGIVTKLLQTVEGRRQLKSTFYLCDDISNRTDYEQNQLFGWMNNAYSYMAMADYPYEATFLGPMPPYPVSVAASYFRSEKSSDIEILESVNKAMNVFYNWTGQAGSCYVVDTEGPSTLGDLGGWDYQSCTEQVLTIGQDGVNDMFWAAPWNLTSFELGCVKKYGVKPRATWIPTAMGSDYDSVSNIVFSNGDLDPWYAGGVKSSKSKSVQCILIKGGAHHLDLRAAHPNDIESVVKARQIELEAIKTWTATSPVPVTPTTAPAPKPADDWINNPASLVLFFGSAVIVGMLLLKGFYICKQKNTSFVPTNTGGAVGNPASSKGDYTTLPQ